MIRRLAPLVAAGLVLAACGSSDEPSADTDAPVETSGSAETSASTTGPAEDEPAASTATPASGPNETGTPADGGSAVVPADAPEALQFSAPLLGGGDIEMAALAGRPVLLWFWSPW